MMLPGGGGDDDDDNDHGHGDGDGDYDDGVIDCFLVGLDWYFRDSLLHWITLTNRCLTYKGANPFHQPVACEQESRRTGPHFRRHILVLRRNQDEVILLHWKIKGHFGGYGVSMIRKVWLWLDLLRIEVSKTQ